MNDHGLITIDSNGTTAETTARLVHAIEKTGMTILARVDHAAAAHAANMSLRPTEVFIFGNPRAGTPLMQLDQRVGIDLPIKVLVWEDELGKTKVTYNTISWIASRHELGPSTDASVKAMTGAIEKVVAEAAGRLVQADAVS
ncbi:DUF302 domain-containing protein [Dyella mobilis]|uniref:DUF302 domain-containing protein n=1 Tax=Dyella mobilis TaxID=1849582 RepID=A0ABS2KDQ0_9GAMM|nr:DUF302 domain-containing protein [Dyella mobilis]MBM7128907.1 DUF302 domain-containing protein [Dyella mobilis]GLQ99403.1 hypothetical protein GCM10007863_38230 [Dyella mobilis]